MVQNRGTFLWLTLYEVHGHFEHVILDLRNKLKLTKKSSGYVHLWTMAESLKEMFVGYPDVPHPVEKILRSWVVDCKLYELASHCHVRWTFGHDKTVRHRLFGWSGRVEIFPRELKPFGEYAANKHAQLWRQTKNRYFVAQKLYTGWAINTAPFLNVNNFAMVSGRKARDRPKVCKFCLEKSIKLA